MRCRIEMNQSTESRAHRRRHTGLAAAAVIAPLVLSTALFVGCGDSDGNGQTNTEQPEGGKQGPPAEVFSGKQSWVFAFQFKGGPSLSGDADLVETVRSGWFVLPVADEYLQCRAGHDAEGDLADCEASNDVWLEGDGQTVRMKKAVLWKKGDRAIAFDAHFSLGTLIVRARFEGAFDDEGKLTGTLGGQAMTLAVKSSPSGSGVRFVPQGAWQISGGTFSLAPSPPAKGKGSAAGKKNGQ